MISFWIATAAMALVASAFVIVPLLRGRPVSGPSAKEANLAVLRGQRREIEQDVAQGTLPAEAREEALAELAARAQSDLSDVPAATVSTRTGRPWIAAAVVAVAIPAGVFALYLALGTPAATDSRATAQQKVDQDHVIAMVEQLAQKVRERPDDARGWTLLARSLAALGRFDESAQAYAHVVTLVPNDPQVLADYADALGMAQGRSLAGKPYDLVKQALAIDPKHHKALALAGTAAFDANDYASAARYWQALADDLPAGSEDEAQVRAMVAEARDKGGLPAAKSSPPRTAVAKAAPPAAPKGTSVTGSVAIAPQLQAKLDGSDTLWVFARAENGPRVPLAVVRSNAGALPMTFSLDDSMAMSPQLKLSSAEAVRIEARVSKSGTPAAQSGDLVGTSEVVKPGARDVKIVIDKVVP
jgi:cytochrome c-type biogenesis protein CcmH